MTSSPPSPAEAAGELLKRREARRGLIAFTEYTYPRYRTSWHHRRIAEELELVERGECDRLMLLTAPRHGKSELASRRFPGYSLGRKPWRQFISASATAGLAGDFGRDVRNLILSSEFRALYGVRLATDSQAKDKWHTDGGGSYHAVGVGSQVIGRGADIFLIDDPFPTMADAQSEAGRKSVWDWYNGSVYNRLQPGGAIVIINHRMHEDDLSGRLLAQQAADGDRWKVVELPAIQDDGSALWPDAYPLEALNRIRRNTLPRFWSSLYQQQPTPDDGNYFKADWLRTYVKAPPVEQMKVYAASDYAVTSGGGDYTVHVVVGMDPDGRMYVLDLWRKQTDSATWIDAWCDLVKLWKPLYWAEESGQINAALGPFILQRAREKKAYVSREGFPSRHDKAVRAQSIRARMAIEGLYLPENAPWVADCRSELLAFPAGKHDDIVDALSLIGQLVDRLQHGTRPKETPSPHRYRKHTKPASGSAWAV